MPSAPPVHYHEIGISMDDPSPGAVVQMPNYRAGVPVVNNTKRHTLSPSDTYALDESNSAVWQKAFRFVMCHKCNWFGFTGWLFALVAWICLLYHIKYFEKACNLHLHK